MASGRPRRVMWLLNHGAARKFEIPMLKRVGFNEIFLPKRFPSQINFRSADIDHSEDQYLTIPADVLEKFNSIDWYAPQSAETWLTASQYFDVIMFIINDFTAATALLRHFKGAAIWRTFGLDKSLSYTKLGQSAGDFEPEVVRMGPRFWFGQAYDNIADIEADYLRRRSIHLPLGMRDVSMRDQWSGQDPRILFVCPDLGFNTYYQDVYQRFKKGFGDLAYVIGGSQPIEVNDPKVLGFLTADEYDRNMRELRVMYYHSQEPRHVHYHPFEAIRCGMPLVFMAGGVLDRMGGVGLPGRAATVTGAHAKLRRILRGDKELAQAIRSSQTVLLERMNFEQLVPAWQSGVNRILGQLDETNTNPRPNPNRKKRVAIIVPVGYRGGSLRGTKLLAKAIAVGSAQAGEAVEVVIGHLDDKKIYPQGEFDDVDPKVKVRPFKWRYLDRAAAKRAMSYGGSASWEGPHNTYCVPDDGIQHFADCDLWVMVSDRLEKPVLPIRPMVVMVYDYIQRYVPLFKSGNDLVFRYAARAAKQVLVTTEFTRKDAIGYAGIQADRVTKVPMLAPEFEDAEYSGTTASKDYFLWSTNAAPHKNHGTALQALSIYYNTLGGDLDCVLTGVNTHGLLDNGKKNLTTAARTLATSRVLRKRVKVVGELEETQYRAAIKGAAFLWHPGTIDNGTFSVVEAAHLGVPSLSSDYPAMREIDIQFGLNLAFSSSDDPLKMARRLKWMQDNREAQKSLLPDAELLASQNVDKLAGAYWTALRGFL